MHKKLTRRVLVATVAVAACFYFMVQRWEIDPRELYGYLATTLLFVGVLVALAFLVATGLRWLRRRKL